jgi:hypothetical protein
MVTVVIEDNAIKVMVVGGNKVKAVVNQPLAEGLVKDGVVMDPKAVGQALKELFKANQIPETDVITSVSGIHSVYRVTRLPKLTSDLMEEAAKREMARLMQVPLEDLYIFWKVISSRASSGENVVPLIGIPRETLDFLMATFRHAGIRCRVIELKPLALARVSDENDSIIINIQPAGFDIVILIGGIPQIVRSLPFSEVNATEKVKVTEVMAELDRTVSFYNSSPSAKTINPDMPVFVSGIYKDMMVNKLSYSVRALPKLLIFHNGFSDEEYVVNAGLALKRGKLSNYPVRVNINFTPAIFLPRPIPVMNIAAWLFIIMAVVIIATMVIDWRKTIAANIVLQEQIKTTQASIVAKTKANLEANKKIEELNKADQEKADKEKLLFQTRLDEVTAQLNIVKAEETSIQQSIMAINTQRDKTNKDMGIIISLISAKATFTVIGYNGVWNITGTAPDADTILTYTHALEKSGRFPVVKLTDIKQVQHDTWSFVIDLSYTPF